MTFEYIFHFNIEFIYAPKTICIGKLGIAFPIKKVQNINPKTISHNQSYIPYIYYHDN